MRQPVLLNLPTVDTDPTVPLMPTQPHSPAGTRPALCCVMEVNHLDKYWYKLLLLRNLSCHLCWLYMLGLQAMYILTQADYRYSWRLLIHEDIPEPAVSVPNAKVTRPAPTAAAEPEDEPPDIKRLSKGVATAP
jgi:hypothetical protein